MQLLTALRNATTKLSAELSDSNLFKHMGDRGEHREAIVRMFLEPFLPKCYGLAFGAIFSADGQSSRQIDVVIYDDVFSNVLFRDSTNSLFPCESVYGNIEVKSNLSSAELAIAVENIQSVKSLPRAQSDMLDLLPYRRLGMGYAMKWDKTKRNPYLGAIFAYDGVTAETVVAELDSRVGIDANTNELLPNFICNYSKQYLVLRGKIEGKSIRPATILSSFDRYIAINTGTDILPIFFLTINTVLNELHLKAPEFAKYWSTVVSAAVAGKPLT